MNGDAKDNKHHQGGKVIPPAFKPELPVAAKRAAGNAGW
jgi:hypothetical protein